MSNEVKICLICKGQDDKEQLIVTIKFYGEKTSLNQKRLCMLYDETEYSFTSLYVTDKETQTEKMTTFNYDDTMKNLLREYIKNDLQCN